MLSTDSVEPLLSSASQVTRTPGGLENVIFIGTGGKIRAVELAATWSGVKNLWQDDLKGVMYRMVQLYLFNEKKILFAATNGHIISFDALTGKQIAHLQPASLKNLLINADLITLWCDGGMLFTASNSTVIAFDIYTLVTIWERDINSTIGKMHAHTLSGHDHTIFVGNAGRVLALSRTSGEIIWENNLKGKGYNPVSTAIYPPTNTLFVGTAGYILLLNAGNGERIAEINLKGTGFHPVTLAIDHDTHSLYAATSGEFYCYNIAQSIGQSTMEKWRSSLPRMSRSFGHSIIFDKDFVFIGMAGNVCALNKHIGQEVWKVSPNNWLPTFVTLAWCSDPEVIICGTNGHLFGLSKSTGKELWQDELKDMGHHDTTLSTEVYNTDFNSTSLPQYEQSVRQHSS